MDEILFATLALLVNSGTFYVVHNVVTKQYEEHERLSDGSWRITFTDDMDV